MVASGHRRTIALRPSKRNVQTGHLLQGGYEIQKPWPHIQCHCDIYASIHIRHWLTEEDSQGHVYDGVKHCQKYCRYRAMSDSDVLWGTQASWPMPRNSWDQHPKVLDWFNRMILKEDYRKWAATQPAETLQQLLPINVRERDVQVEEGVRVLNNV